MEQEKIYTEELLRGLKVARDFFLKEIGELQNKANLLKRRVEAINREIKKAETPKNNPL